jgi:hypothetical protein
MMEEKPQVPSSVYEDENLLFKWSYNDRRASDWRKLYNILFEARSFADYIDHLNKVWDRDALAMAFNDSPEA